MSVSRYSLTFHLVIYLIISKYNPKMHDLNSQFNNSLLGIKKNMPGGNDETKSNCFITVTSIYLQ